MNPAKSKNKDMIRSKSTKDVKERTSSLSRTLSTKVGIGSKDLLTPTKKKDKEEKKSEKLEKKLEKKEKRLSKEISKKKMLDTSYASSGEDKSDEKSKRGDSESKKQQRRASKLANPRRMSLNFIGGSLGFGSKKKEDKQSELRKVKIEISLNTVMDLPQSLNGRTVYFRWKAGSHKKSGITKRALVTQRTAFWEDSICFECFFVRKSDETYEPRTVTLKLKDDKENKLVSKTHIELSQYLARDMGDLGVNKVKELGTGKGKLKFKVNMTLLQINNKQIVSVADVNEVDPTDPNVYVERRKAYITRTVENFGEEKDSASSWSSSDVEFDLSNNKSQEVPVVTFAGDLNKSDVNEDINKKKVEELENSVKQKESLIRVLEDELSLNSKKIYQLQTQNSNLKKRLETFENPSANPDLTNGIEGSQNTELEGKCQRLQLEIDDQKEKTKASLADNNELRTQLHSANMLISKYKRDLQASTQRVEELEKASELAKEKEKESGNPFDTPDSGNPFDEETNTEESMRKKIRNAMGQNGSDKTTNEPKKKEIDVEHIVTQIVYRSDFNMNRFPSDQKLQYPASGQALFDALISEEPTVTPIYPKIFEAITTITSKKPKTSFEVATYWLSSTCVLKHLMEEHGVYNPDLVSATNQLFYHLFNQIVKSFTDVVATHVVEAFCSSSNNDTVTSPQFARVTPHKSLPSSKVHKHSPFSSNNFYNTKWNIEDIIFYLNDALNAFKNLAIPITLIQYLFNYLIFSINRIAFNALLSTPQLCTAGNGFQIKLNVSKTEEWINHANNKIYTEGSSVYLKELSEAANILTLDKSVLVQDDSVQVLICPSLNIHQIKQIVFSFQTDKIFTEPVLPSILDELARKCTKMSIKPIILQEKKVGFENPLDLFFLKIPLEQQFIPRKEQSNIFGEF